MVFALRNYHFLKEVFSFGYRLRQHFSNSDVVTITATFSESMAPTLSLSGIHQYENDCYLLGF